MEVFERIAGYLAGSCSPKEKKELEAWRKEAPANEEEYCKIAKIWEAATQPARFRPNADHAWKKVSTCIFQQTAEVKVKKQPLQVSFYRTPWAVAAAVSLFIVATAVFLINRPDALSGSGNKLTVTETETQEKQTLTLSDGSRIWLNENSKIFYPENFGGDTREVKLEGEAYFEVAELPDKPFIVHAGAAIVKVLGTSFNLEAKEKVKVQVAGGRVSFSPSGSGSQKSLTLTAGDAAYLEGNTLKKDKPDPNFLAWKTGVFVFEDSPLQEVFRSLETYYPVKLSAASSGILKCRLFARFEDQPLEEVLKVLSLTLSLAYEYEPGQAEVVFRPQGQNCVPSVQ